MEQFTIRKAVAFALAFLFLVLLMENASRLDPEAPTKKISYSLFKKELAADRINKVIISENEIKGVMAEGFSAPGAAAEVREVSTSISPIEDASLLSFLEEKEVEIEIKLKQQDQLWWIFLANSLPWLLLLGIFIWTMRRAQNAKMGTFGSFGQATAVVIDGEVPKVTFSDVAGLENPKIELMEAVEFLRSPDKFTNLGGKIPKGVLLTGPPGTGKTLLAKALAGEAQVPFFSISASEFIEMFVGVGAARVRNLFQQAQAKAPSIIFIDEIDAVGRSRGTGVGGGHDEREQTLNQLLSEMDGFEGHENVIVTAATNRPDVLDPALLRPGRFDRRVVIDMPNQAERLAILKVHTRKIPLDPDIDLDIASRSSPGFSGADLGSLCNEAALFAARADESRVAMKHFELAKDKILMGLKRPGLTSESEIRITAFHEAGHALAAKLIPGMDPIHKISIIPRGASLGLTQLLPESDRHYYPKSYLLGKIAVNLGGRAAEKIIFGETSTGAQNDLRQSTDLAEKMVCQWGMSEKIGPVTFNRGEEHAFLGKKLAGEKTYSEQMGWIIDKEIEELVHLCEKRSLEILQQNTRLLELVATALIKREEITGEEMDELLRSDEGTETKQ
jgi:cell division protease FtsH